MPNLCPPRIESLRVKNYGALERITPLRNLCKTPS